MFAFFATMVARLVVSPVVPQITNEFEISNTAVGAALSAMWVSYSFSQFPSGILGDKFGERRVILLAVGGTAVGGILLAISPIFPIFIFCVIILGGAAGLHYTPATVLLERTYENVGTAVGIHTAGAPLAGLITPIAAAGIAVQFGWRVAIALIAVVSLPIFLLILWKVRPTTPRNPQVSMRSHLDLRTAYNLLSKPSILFTMCLMTACAFVWQGIASFLPTFLVQFHGRSTTFASIIFSAYFVTQGVAQVGVGAVSDRFNGDYVLVGCMFLGALGLYSLVMIPNSLIIIGGAILLGIAMSYNPVIIPRFLENFSEDERGTGLGLVRTTYGIFGASGSVVVGFFADVFGWGFSFTFLIAVVLLVVLIVAINEILSLGY